MRVRTSAIERPDPNGDLYFIRSHDFTPVTRTVYPESQGAARCFFFCTQVESPRDRRSATLLSTDTANLSSFQTALRLIEPMTHFAILLEARRAPDDRSSYRVNVLSRTAARNARVARVL